VSTGLRPAQLNIETQVVHLLVSLFSACLS